MSLTKWPQIQYFQELRLTVAMLQLNRMDGGPQMRKTPMIWYYGNVPANQRLFVPSSRDFLFDLLITTPCSIHSNRSKQELQQPRATTKTALLNEQENNNPRTNIFFLERSLLGTSAMTSPVIIQKTRWLMGTCPHHSTHGILGRTACFSRARLPWVG